MDSSTESRHPPSLQLDPTEDVYYSGRAEKQARRVGAPPSLSLLIAPVVHGEYDRAEGVLDEDLFSSDGRGSSSVIAEIDWTFLK